MLNSTAKNLSDLDTKILVLAAAALTEQQLLDGVQYGLKWGPVPNRAGERYILESYRIPIKAWGALLEMESWGAAQRSKDGAGDLLLVDGALFDMVIKVIRRLLETLVSPQLELTPVERPTPKRPQRCERRMKIDPDELGVR